MKKKKIAVVGIRGIPATYGGIEKHCEVLYPILVENGFDVTVYARGYYCKDNLTEYKGVKIKNIPVFNIKGFEAFIHSFIETLFAFGDSHVKITSFSSFHVKKISSLSCSHRFRKDLFLIFRKRL